MSSGDLDAERIACLRLIRSANIGPVTYRQLVARFGSGSAALAAVPDLAARGGGLSPRLASAHEVAREAECVQAGGARYLFIDDPAYPPLLAAVESAPPALIVAGDPALLSRPAIAMVGARNASAAGCRLARQIAHELAGAGQLIVSGLARGIDTAAHEGALGLGSGSTAAVVAGGFDVFYPPENEGLQRRIAREAVLVSEQPPGCEPRARHFPYRNRIIAGLAAATLVVEAAPRSGSLITARRAGDYGRDVLAIPGSPLDPRAQGCNLLIREGATLIQSAEDVLEAVRPMGGSGGVVRQPPSPFAEAAGESDASEAERRAVAALLGPVPVPVDEVIRQAGLPAAVVQTVLLELELAARLERHAGGRVTLVG